MSETYNDHSPLPWSVDDSREGYEGLVTVFDRDGRPVMSFGDMEDCEWRDICDAHIVAHRVNCYDDMFAALLAAETWFSGSVLSPMEQSIVAQLRDALEKAR